MAVRTPSRLTTIKWGGANFLGHTNDGFKATCIIEVYVEQEVERDCEKVASYPYEGISLG